MAVCFYPDIPPGYIHIEEGTRYNLTYFLEIVNTLNFCIPFFHIQGLLWLIHTIHTRLNWVQ